MTGINRITQAFEGKTAFMPYVALGYPTVEDSMAAVQALAEGGADLIELGVPFSDPLADGPTIQMATQQALENGVTVRKCLEMAQKLREAGVTTPFMLMGYMNPFLAYGIDRLGQDAQAAGIDGFIVPDLPPEEALEFDTMCAKYAQALIYFLAPTSTPERIQLAADKARGFLYLVSLTGVTGARDTLSASLPDFLSRVRKVTDKPLAVGFGVGNGEQARDVAQYADGVIIGSAVVKCCGKSTPAVRAFAEEIVTALKHKN